MAMACCLRRQLILLLSLIIACFGLSPLSVVLYSTAGSGGRRQISSCADQGSTTKAYSWIDRVYQLIEYRDLHGDTLVPKRHADNPALGNWVNKQRQEYKKGSLTEEKIQVLNDVGFCWDGRKRKTPNLNQTKIAWWERLEELRGHSPLLEEELPASLNRWLNQQRKEYQSHLRGEACNLDEEKIMALDEINSDWWKPFRQRQWEARCRELIEYREHHGDCSVPINYENRKLANWVSNTRKKYNLSELTEEQILELNEIGFVWNHWEHEFERFLT